MGPIGAAVLTAAFVTGGDREVLSHSLSPDPQVVTVETPGLVGSEFVVGD